MITESHTAINEFGEPTFQSAVRPWTCARCGEGPLSWQQIEGRWTLCGASGKAHACRESQWFGIPLFGKQAHLERPPLTLTADMADKFHKAMNPDPDFLKSAFGMKEASHGT